MDRRCFMKSTTGLIVPALPIPALATMALADREIVEERTRYGKKYSVSAGRKRLHTGMIPIHYKEYGKWHDMDLQFRWLGRKCYVTGHDWIIEIDPSRVGVNLIDRQTGDRSVVAWLSEINGLSYTTPPSLVVEGNCVTWRNVARDLNVSVRVTSTNIVLEKVMLSPEAPRSFVTSVIHEPGYQVDPFAGGLDNFASQIGRKRKLHTLDTVHRRGTLAKQSLSRITQKWDGKTISRNPVTRIPHLDDEVTWPARMHATFGPSSITNNADGCREDNDATITTSTPAISAGMRSAASTRNVGARFTNVTVAQGATINNLAAGTKLEVYCTSITGTPDIDAAGNDVDNAAAWSGSERPSNMTQTAASEEGISFTATSYTDVDIQSAAQTIVNRGSWSSGNAMKFGLLNQATGTWNIVFLKDYVTWDTANPMMLTIDYTEGAGGTTLPAIYMRIGGG